MLKSIKLILFILLVGPMIMLAQNEENAEGHEVHADQDHASEVNSHEGDEGHHATGYDPKNTAYHHIGNQNVYSIGELELPLPCFLYSPGEGWSTFMSSEFDPGHHGNGHYAYKGYVLVEGSVFKVIDEQFPKGKVQIDDVAHKTEKIEGKDREVNYVLYQGEEYKLDARTTFDGGLLGGGVTSFYDFSITKNVVFMVLVGLFLGWVFISVARSYKRRQGRAPKGMQSFFEPLILFVRDEVAMPFIGHKYDRYFPFLLSLFFFILALNLLGQIPFLGSANVTGNLSVTFVLAFITFLVVNLNGKKDYWAHIFWMPGAPWWVKISVLSLVEFLGLFIKPFTLMLRLFANITAGHMVVLTFVGLIFIFGKAGESVGGSLIGLGLALPLTLFMMALELLVAFIQAFVFTMLAASYIGAAIEEHH